MNIKFLKSQQTKYAALVKKLKPGTHKYERAVILENHYACLIGGYASKRKKR